MHLKSDIRYAGEHNGVDDSSGETRMRLKTDGNLQLVCSVESDHATESIRTTEKRFSVGLDDSGTDVIRDEINEADALIVTP